MMEEVCSSETLIIYLQDYRVLQSTRPTQKNESESRWPGLKNQSHLVGKTNRSSTSSIAFMSHQLKRILFLFIYPANQYTIDIGQVTKLILIGKNIYYR
jgi:hypothetical protein